MKARLLLTVLLVLLLPAAACFCLVIAAAGLMKSGYLNAPVPPEKAGQSYTAEFAGSSGLSSKPAPDAQVTELEIETKTPEIAHPPLTDEPQAAEDNSFGGPDSIVASGFGDGGAACYKAPENGTVGFSIPLTRAMEEYGGTVLYQVKLDIFENETPLAPDSGEALMEMERLYTLGYDAKVETVTLEENGERFDRTAISLFATYEQLQNFTAPDNYGYMLFLYYER